MKSKTVFFILFVYFCKVDINALSFPGPRVYVVTPSPRSVRRDEDKITPFYYNKWMRRMDTEQNVTTTTTPAPIVKTPDLIFAEFESDGSKQKSIRKLLEQEKITKSTTMNPIYVPEPEENKVTRIVNYGLPVRLTDSHDKTSNEITTAKSAYPFMFDKNYYNNVQVPVNVPSTTKPTTKITTTTTTENTPINIENIWHIIDNQKSNQYSGKWQEVQVKPEEENAKHDSEETNHTQIEDDKDQNDEVKIDENFALPGFATSSGSGAENESRAIRVEPNMRFPYVNLKPFQMKSSKKPSLNNLSSKKNSNLLTSLDNFSDLKHPVRGEAQDIVPLGSHIDRYNPAQPYLPQPSYGSKISKQSNPVITPQKATANLVPPPPPPSKGIDDDFPAPATYDSFPPYAPSGPSYNQPALPSKTPSTSIDSQVLDMSSDSLTSDSSDDDSRSTMNLGYRYKPPADIEDDNGSPMINMGYQYKPPSPPVPQFFPTIPPPPKPSDGYSYNKPNMNSDTAPLIVADKPEIHGYHYGKPEPSNTLLDHMPPSYDSPPSYGHDDLSQIKGHNGDYPELRPPSPPTDMKPDMYGPSPSDNDFPIDFPTDFKFHHDFDDHDHDHDHYHYHHTTTTTTETPRVNRFSYYYLGKKLYYLPLYFSVYFIIYVGALIVKAVLRHKIVYPNSWRPNTTTATFFSKRSVDEFMSNENLHDVTRKVTHAIATAAEKYMDGKKKTV